MVLSIVLLVTTALLAGLLLRCIKSFGDLSAKIDRSVASNDALRDVIKETLPSREPLPIAATMVNKPRTPGIRPWSPGADELEYIPPTEHSA